MTTSFLDLLPGCAILKIGRPCCGKNKQSGLLEEFLRSQGRPVTAFETSKLLSERRSLANDQVANRIAYHMGRGEIVPADIVCEVVNDFTAQLDPKATLIVNGFPRSEEQCFGLHDTLHRQRVLAVEIQITREEALYRSTHRKAEEGRADDEAQQAIKRQMVYEQHLPGLRRGLSQQRVVVIKVDGSGDLTTVRDRIINDLNLYLVPAARRLVNFA